MPAAFLLIWFTSVNGLHVDYISFPATREQNFCEQLAKAEDEMPLVLALKIRYEGGPLTITRVKCRPVPPTPPKFEVVEDKYDEDGIRRTKR